MSETDKQDHYAAPPDVWPKDASSGSGGHVGYTVEARIAYNTPETVAGTVLDTRWRPINFTQAAQGVRERAGSPFDVATYGLHNWAAAQALRWWFHAEAELQRHGSFCLETRIVAHQVSFYYSVKATGAHAEIGGNGHRSHKGPDKGDQPVVQEEPV
jgi:hypothetical protein